MSELASFLLVQLILVIMRGIRGGARGRRRALIILLQNDARNQSRNIRTNAAHKLNFNTFMRKLLPIPYAHCDLGILSDNPSGELALPRRCDGDAGDGEHT